MKRKNMYLIGALAILIIVGAALAITNSDNSSRIDVVGSTSVQPVVEKLVDEYKKSHPDSQINVQGGGSSVGIKSASDGTADIGTSSKELDDSDKKGLKEYKLGNDGIVIVTNNQNTIADLSTEQLKDIFSGKVTNWNQVGGSDGEIHVVTREEGSGTLDAFESIVMGDAKIISSAVVQSSTEAVKQSVSQDPNAIGFISFANMDDEVKSISVNGVMPSEETLADNSYEIQRPFLLLTKGEPSGDVKDFIDWIMSDEGSKILADEKIIKSSK